MAYCMLGTDIDRHQDQCIITAFTFRRHEHHLQALFASRLNREKTPAGTNRSASKINKWHGPRIGNKENLHGDEPSQEQSA